jgi:hypothetical protein
MKYEAPALRTRPSRKFLCALAAVFAVGAAAASAAASFAAPLDSCVLPVSCPTISTPTLPPISVPLPLPLPTTTAAPATTSTTPPASSGQVAETEAATASAPFTFTVAHISARRLGGLRRIDVELSLSHAAMVVAILHRGDVPSFVGVRSGRMGTNRFLLIVPARVSVGRHTLSLVIGTGTERRTFTQSISLPK